MHSALSLPLITPAGVIGSLNAYGHSRDAFDEHSQSVASVIAVPAAVSMENLQVLAQIERLGSSLRTALADLAVVDQSVGILRSRHGLGADEARSRLHDMTQEGGGTLLGAASEVVHDAVVQARRDGGSGSGH